MRFIVKNVVRTVRKLVGHHNHPELEKASPFKKRVPVQRRVKDDDLSWGYDAHNGPHTWARYHICAAGASQSPVNIELSRVSYDPTLQRNPLKLEQTTCENVVLLNHGRGFRLEFDTDATLSGGPLTSTYSFAQMHMHWGLSRHYGSEHAINGLTYAAEMHLVFIDKKRFPSFNDAIRRNVPDALCVLGVIVEEGIEDPIMEPIVDCLPLITYRDQKVAIQGRFQLTSFLPKNLHDYFTYPGSLTTPPCSEVVQWILFKESMGMSERQLNSCRSMRETFEDDEKHSTCEINFRTYCPVGSRVIRSSFQVDK